MTAEDASFYDSALRRMDRLGYGLAVVAVLSAAALQGWRGALGAVIGAALSFVNLRLWKRVANSISPSGERPQSASAVLLGMRYLLLGSIVFVIIKYFEVSLLAVLLGLLVSVAAVLLEIVYELIFTPRA